MLGPCKLVATAALSNVGVVEKKGFETVFEVLQDASYLQIAAVQNGTEVRRSNTVRVS